MNFIRKHPAWFALALTLIVVALLVLNFTSVRKFSVPYTQDPGEIPNVIADPGASVLYAKIKLID